MASLSIHGIVEITQDVTRHAPSEHTPNGFTTLKFLFKDNEGNTFEVCAFMDGQDADASMSES